MQQVLSGDKSHKPEHGQASIQSFRFDQSLMSDLLCRKFIPIAFLGQEGCRCHGFLREGPDRSMTAELGSEEGAPVFRGSVSGPFQIVFAGG